MKIENIRALEQFLSSKDRDSLPSLFFLMSKDEADIDLFVQTILATLQTANSAEQLHLGTQSFDLSASSEAAMVFEELGAFSLFEAEKIVVVRHVELMEKSQRSRLRDMFASLKKNQTTLIISGSGIAATTKFFKEANAHGVTLNLLSEKPWERENRLIDWLLEQAKLSGKRMDRGTCSQLVKQIGADQALLSRELEKLLCYVGDRMAISAADVSALSITVPTDTVWQLGDAILEKQAGEALRILSALMESSPVAIGTLAALRSQFQKSFQICSMIESGGNTQSVAKAFPYMSERIRDRNIRLARQYGMAAFKRGMLTINACDIQLRNSMTDSAILMETLIVKLTG